MQRSPTRCLCGGINRCRVRRRSTASCPARSRWARPRPLPTMRRPKHLAKLRCRCEAPAHLFSRNRQRCLHGSSNNGEHGPHHTRAASVIGRPQAANLAMSSGRASARYVITAPDPARHAFDVSVSAPASVDVAVRIDTWYGAEFPSILVSSHQADSCKLRGSQDVCFERFPLLPAQRAGAWTVVAAKPSGPATTVHVVITFAKP